MSRAVLLAVLALGLLAAFAVATPTVHEFDTKKAKIIVTVKHGEDEPAESAAPVGHESADDESADEESSEGGQESAAEESTSLGAKDLDRYTLPPEPAAAKGYKSVRTCDEDPCDKDDDMEFRESAPCTENCEADSVGNSNSVTGPAVLSQPLGGKDGYVPVRDTRTSNSENTWVIVPQTGASSQDGDLASNVISSDAVSGESSCECEVCPCPKFQSPEEKKAEKLAQLVEQERTAREKEKSELHEALAKHQANLAKIDAMGRALRWQYTQLRRHHNILRTHIAANKAAYDELGGDDEYKGTDYDIEARPPPLYESLDDIPALTSQKLDPKVVAKVTQEVESAQAREKTILKGMQSATNDNIRAMLGNDAAPKA